MLIIPTKARPHESGGWNPVPVSFPRKRESRFGRADIRVRHFNSLLKLPAEPLFPVEDFGEQFSHQGNNAPRVSGTSEAAV